MSTSLANLSKPLDNFPLMRTSSIEEVRETLSRIYAKPVLTPTGGVRMLDATMNYCALSDLRLYYRAYGADVRLEFPETGYLLQLIPLGGNGELTIGRKTISLAAGTGAVVSTDMSWQLNCSADYEHLAVRIDAEALTRTLAALTGETIGEPLRMEPQQGSDSPTARVLPRYVQSLVNSVSAAAHNAPLPDWWSSQTEQLLMTMLLHCNRHNYSHLLEEAAPDVTAMEVRRAEDYIEANWREPITLEDLAAVTGVSVLALFRSFKKFRGYSPLEFVAQTRQQRGGMRW